MSTLLPLPDGVRDPDAYQVFGLVGPVADIKTVASAIRQTIQNLQASKADADQNDWQEAAELVKHAKATLADPIRKAALDQSLTAKRSAASNAAPLPASGSQSPSDPLAGILPKIDPLAGILPKMDVPPSQPVRQNPVVQSEGDANISQPTNSQVDHQGTAGDAADINETDIDETPPPPSTIPDPPRISPAEITPSSTPVVGETASPQESFAAPVRVAARKKRRRGSPLVTLMMTMICLALLAMVGILSYVVFVKPDALALRQDKPAMVVAAPRESSAKSAKASAKSARPNRSAKPRDPIMGNLGSGGGAPANESFKSTIPDAVAAPGTVASSSMMAKNDNPRSSANSDSMTPSSEATKTSAESPTTVSSNAELNNTEPKNAVPSGGDLVVTAAKVINQRQWSEMVAAIEQIRDQPMSKAQSDQIEPYYVIANLAAFFRGGIERGISRQNAGGQFEVVPGMIVGVVGKGSDNQSLTLNINARPREYQVDTMPFSLADRLASFVITPEDDFETASAVYHCVAPQCKDETLRVELNYLRSQSPPVESVTGAQIADAIEFIKRQ